MPKDDLRSDGFWEPAAGAIVFRHSRTVPDGVRAIPAGGWLPAGLRQTPQTGLRRMACKRSGV